MPSAKLYYVDLFPVFSLAFFFFLLIENEILEQVSWKIATEEPKKGF